MEFKGLPVLFSLQHIDGATTLGVASRDDIVNVITGHFEDAVGAYDVAPELKEKHTAFVTDFLVNTEDIGENAPVYVDTSFEEGDWSVVLAVHPSSINAARFA